MPAAAAPILSVLGDLTELATSAIGDYGLYAVFLLMLGDAILPANEAVMLYAGALAAGAFSGSVVLFGVELERGVPAYLAVATAGTVGSTLGALGGWAVGRYLGRPFILEHERWLRLGEVDLARGERWLERWGDPAVPLSRLTPVIRSVAPLAAGILRMRFGRYTVLTLLGTAVYCFAYAALGYAVGSEWERIHDRLGILDYVVLGALVAGAGWLLVRRARRRRRAEDATEEEQACAE
ncbi:MAG: DedA family protein [Thermoleophilia bacterium]|nr:DedA family protein [Gaiellaceae bacterium]MDW8339585.1 DedA family protein [Thermoleophilia bacterium]